MYKPEFGDNIIFPSRVHKFLHEVISATNFPFTFSVSLRQVMKHILATHLRVLRPMLAVSPSSLAALISVHKKNSECFHLLLG